jgi:excisionase family DNA binding protein
MQQNSPDLIMNGSSRSAYLTPKAVANYLGISMTTMYRMLNANNGLPRLKILNGKEIKPTYLIPKKGFFTWIKQNET